MKHKTDFLWGRRAWALGLALAAWGSVALSAADLELQRLFGPEIPTGPYKHPASFDQLQNGDLYLVFFSGQGEYGDNAASVYGSRQRAGTRRWTRPVAVARHPFRSLGNPVLWQAPDGVVWLFYVVREGETWADSRVAAKISRDGAATWSDAFMVTFEAGTMVRAHPIVLASGEYLLPLYHEIGTDTELVDARCTSFFLRYDPAARRWTESPRVRSRLGNIQPAVVALDASRLIAFCRRGGDYAPRPDGWLVRTESHDGGHTWSEGADSAFPNPNAAVDFIRLRNGHLLLVYNDSLGERAPLTAAVSRDEGRTFPRRRNLAEAPGDFAYPTAVQTRDGRIRVLFTSDERTVLRMAVFTEDALGGM